jgi:hypothetical protein
LQLAGAGAWQRRTVAQLTRLSAEHDPLITLFVSILQCAPVLTAKKEVTGEEVTREIERRARSGSFESAERAPGPDGGLWTTVTLLVGE